MPRGPLPPVGDPVAWQFEYEARLRPAALSAPTQRTSTSSPPARTGSSPSRRSTPRGSGDGAGASTATKVAATTESSTTGPYWHVARNVFGLNGPRPPQHCQLSLAYQAVRNAAAGLEMTGLRAGGSFGLVYDDRNPFFAGAGEWPGWANWLQANDAARVVVHAISWQEIIQLLPRSGRAVVLSWASEKHGL
jgi:hypothetical protein